MTAIPRLLRIEIRRNIGLWLFPVMIGLAWFIALWWRPDLRASVTLWPEVDAGIRNGALFLGPLAAGLGAWAASRDRRRQMEDLLATMPRPAFGRDLTALAASASWVLIAYVAAATVLAAHAFTQTAGGGPSGVTLLVGLTSITAMSAAGFALGRFTPSRFVAPMVAMAFLVVLGLLFAQGRGTAFAFLTPVDDLRINLFRAAPAPDSQGIPQILWFAGLTAVGLTVIALRRRLFLAGGGMLVAALAITGLGADLILSGEVAALEHDREPVAFEPVCTKGSFPVCVHPAYAGALADVAAVMQKVVAPVEGLPGVPVRAEQRELRDAYVVQPDGTVYFELANHLRGADAPRRWRHQADDLAGLLVTEPGSVDGPPVPVTSRCSAQDVLLGWLMTQAGLGANIVSPVERAALERFSALAPVVRQAWLHDYFTDLRAGALTLEDLPVEVDVSECFTRESTPGELILEDLP